MGSQIKVYTVDVELGYESDSAPAVTMSAESPIHNTGSGTATVNATGAGAAAVNATGSGTAAVNTTAAGAAPIYSADDDGVTFFVVSDLHYKDDDSTNARNMDQVECMNALLGTPYPTATGGNVGTARGVLNLGDTIHGSTHLPDAWTQYTADYGIDGTDGVLTIPHYKIRGNHDFSGPEPNYVKEQIIARYGAESYVLSWGDLRIIMVDYGPDADQLAWVQTQLSAIGTSAPIIIATHIGFDDTNSIPDEWSQAEVDAFIAAISGYNVIGYFYGHVHTVSFYTYSGLSVYRVGSPADEVQNHNSVIVVKVTDENMYVNEWEWHAERLQWGDSDIKAI
jgi:predicted phosphodiesterase